MGIKWFDFDNDGKMDLFLTDMHSDMAKLATPEEEKLKPASTYSAHMLGGENDEFIFGNALYHNLGRRQVRGDLRQDGRRELLAVGPERRGLERRRLAGHLHQRRA